MMDDAELLLGTPNDPELFGIFYRRHEDAVLGYMARRARDTEAAADLTAETFAAALLHVRRFDPDRGDARAWLFAIARNTLAKSIERGQALDRARRRLGIGHIELGPDVASLVEGLADDVQAQTSIGELPPDEAAALRARVIDGDTYEEIATDLNISMQAARKRVSRGLARLRARRELQ